MDVECKFCCDKGWHSELIGGYRIAPDFENDVEYLSGNKIVANYCPKCKKGKRLKNEARRISKKN